MKQVVGVLLSALYALTVTGADTLKLDLEIRKAVKTWWHPCPIHCDWRWLRAQIKAESLFDPDAVSKDGALGIAQFMEPAWKELQTDGIIPAHVTRHDWKWSIRGAARYMRQLIWHPRRPWADSDDKSKLQSGQAAYNAGVGNVNRAFEACKASDYNTAMKCLPAITGARSEETITYVKRIERYFKDSI